MKTSNFHSYVKLLGDILQKSVLVILQRLLFLWYSMLRTQKLHQIVQWNISECHVLIHNGFVGTNDKLLRLTPQKSTFSVSIKIVSIEL